MSDEATSASTIFTIGHSNRTWDDFVAILRAHGAAAIADVRRYPGSRRLPWFNSQNMTAALPQLGMAYWRFPELGGRRRSMPDSRNTGWRNEGFRGYADYMQTPQFADILEQLMACACQTSTAIMCAEAVPWRCHRSLIADALIVRGWKVLDIFDTRNVRPHKLTPFARVDGLSINYPEISESGLLPN